MPPPPFEPPPGDPNDMPADGPHEEGETPLRGWIDPDDRLWRHPSEVGGGVPGRATTVVLEQAHRFHGRVMLVIGVAASVAAAAWIVVLLSPSSERLPVVATQDAAANAPLTTLAGAVRSVPSIADTASHSIVQLRVDTSGGVVYLTGVAVAEGGVVATTADALLNRRALSMVGASGQLLPAKVIGMDKASDVALVAVPDDLPVAPFADDTALYGGNPDLTLTLAGSNGGVPTLHCLTGWVANVAGTMSDGPAKGMPAIVSANATGAMESGDPLLNSSGSVVGIYYEGQPSPTGPTTTMFLPSQLIIGVSDDLRSNGDVDPGSLGVDGTTNDNPTGVTVTAVDSDGPSNGFLQPGDVIVSVNSLPVHSWADLNARLYVLGPNAPVQLSVVSGPVHKIVDVTLGPSS